MAKKSAASAKSSRPREDRVDAPPAKKKKRPAASEETPRRTSDRAAPRSRDAEARSERPNGKSQRRPEHDDLARAPKSARAEKSAPSKRADKPSGKNSPKSTRTSAKPAAKSGRRPAAASGGSATVMYLMIGLGALIVLLVIVVIVVALNPAEEEAPAPADTSGDYASKMELAKKKSNEAQSYYHVGVRKKKNGEDPIPDFKKAWEAAVAAQNLAADIRNDAKTKGRKVGSTLDKTEEQVNKIFFSLRKDHGFSGTEYGLSEQKSVDVDLDDFKLDN